MACVMRAERNSFFPVYHPFPPSHLCPLPPQYSCQLPLGGSPPPSTPHRSLGRFKRYWLGVWVLVPAGWVQILALPLISHATLDRLLNLLVP